MIKNSLRESALLGLIYGGSFALKTVFGFNFVIVMSLPVRKWAKDIVLGREKNCHIFTAAAFIL